MKNYEKIIEIEALLENITKHYAENNLLRMKILYFISEYQNLSVGMIIDKLGIKKSNFALMTKELEREGLVVSKQGEIDKRCRMLYLTEKGKNVLNSYLEEIGKYFSEEEHEISKAIETLNIYLNKKI